MEKPAPAAVPPPSAASQRWSILRRACLSRPSPLPDNPKVGTTNVSRKAAGGFNLISCHPLHGQLVDDMGILLNKNDLAGPRDIFVCYNLPGDRVLKLIVIQRMNCVNINDFEISTRHDVDTTGLVCCWPTEEVLAYISVNNPNMFRSKRVLELGSGYGLAGLAIAAATNAYEVIISDGNPEVVDYIQRSIDMNNILFGETKVKSRTLHWKHELDSDILSSFDIIIASDCTFFKEFHESLAHVVKSLLKRSDTSGAIFLSPRRGDSLENFLKKVKDIGLRFELIENYDTKVWNIHQKFVNGDDTSWPNYVEDHCYPLMVRITF